MAGTGNDQQFLRFGRSGVSGLAEVARGNYSFAPNDAEYRRVFVDRFASLRP